MHSRLTKAKQQQKDKGVKSDNQQATSPKGAMLAKNSFNPKRASNPVVVKPEAASERAYPWENRALDAQAIELKKIVKNY